MLYSRSKLLKKYKKWFVNLLVVIGAISLAGGLLVAVMLLVNIFMFLLIYFS